MECCSLRTGMCVLTQVTKLDSVPAPADKNMPFWNPPGDAFVWAVHYLTVTCLSAGRDRGDTALCLTRPEWLHSRLLLLITVITPGPFVQWLILWCNDSAKWLNYTSPAWKRCSHLRLLSAFFPPAGSAYYDNVRPLAYPDADAVLICFDVSRPETLDSVTKKVGSTSKRERDCASFNY